ncbi:MAG: enolase C-terminal domain-like protein, partial [Dehalococcoidia bacterium]|nr:enolase C-terminal domain-like protein [Dehalococcoidia bacterium]
TAAALHLAATLPAEGPAHGLATGALLAADIVARPLAVRAGRMALPEGPGLGVELDEGALARYGMRSREVRW